MKSNDSRIVPSRSHTNTSERLNSLRSSTSKPQTTTSGNEKPPKLKFFESPLVHEKRSSAHEESTKLPSPVVISAPLAFVARKSYISTDVDNIYDDRKFDNYQYVKDDIQETDLHESPEFKRYKESTNIELFYDLFFIANLTTFTDVLEINSTTNLKNYAGFFSILWFLWLQVSLFDVRWVTDSIIERIFKAAQFGVMIGLAATGPRFDPENQGVKTFRSLAIILMLSRLVLVLQYGSVLYHVWYYKKSKGPLAMLMGSNFVAAMIYLGTTFGFRQDGQKSMVYIIWYITAGLETAFNIGVSSKFKVLTFHGSHLVQRMSLLTLIILGEGVIGICKSIATIVEIEPTWPMSLIGTIVAAVTIVYVIYMIYFDWIMLTGADLLRQEIWAFLHFPFHLALVLLVEGTSQFIIWRKVVEAVQGINDSYSEVIKEYNLSNNRTSVGLSTVIVETTIKIYEHFPPIYTSTISETQDAIYKIGNATFGSAEQTDGLKTLFATVQDSIFNSFNIEPPAPAGSEMTIVDPKEEWERHLEAFMFIFVYFFVAAGIMLILMNTLNVISRAHMTKGDYFRVTVYFSTGILLSGVASTVTNTKGFEFAQSPWVLPTVAIALGFVMAFGYTKSL
ncbi:hypothetical protein HYALB_00006754 [Hymenoscyphus albidus]|uniref:Low temperature requirement A n=1 Tax=Hymenoscyphus albidus TaxID=595503 RepID=A0A9N9QD51_9HELO|nr:hypothetical protein HYALB_00006754 [Hymenoscyphus albidus]